MIFSNNGSLANPIKNYASSTNGAVFDYVLYTTENVVHSDGFNKNTNPIIRSQGYAVVTVVGQVPIEFSYTDEFFCSGQPGTGLSARYVGQGGELWVYD
ncbi:hypothetical protein [Paenibacillus sp. FSL H7-689]|uniref:hypothetical protein n=1 Tax=Paenibacillus sp. FSL H7-689 TaxID=1227349 RepID=UPI0003E201AA|nr:hypothetical protein [Paenibacillus sp. FSL H7-689]ETT44847.1 hypothetical protein C170_23135 [Paenibacillus sp. FSL H7-689]